MKTKKTEPMSAAGRFGTAAFLAAAHRFQDCPPDEGAEAAFLGHSNSGKSSAINAIVGRKGLARSSKEPGRTRQIVFFGLSGGRLVDLPGFGFAQVAPELRRHWDKTITAYLESRRSLKGIVLVADIRRGIAEAEQGFLRWCGQAQLPAMCLLSKADKLSRSERVTVLRRARSDFGEMTIVPFSAVSGEGVETARQVLDLWLS